MPKQIAQLVRSPAFNEFLYTALFEAPYEMKRNLRGKFLKAAASHKAAKRFVANSTWDEKMYVLTHLGFTYFYVVCKRGIQDERVKYLFEKFTTNQKASGLKGLSEEGLYIIGAEQFMHQFSIMARGINHPSYFLNLELSRQGYHIEKWKNRISNQKDSQNREVSESALTIARLLLSHSVCVEYAKGLIGISETQLMVLLYLYTNMHRYICDTELKEFFKGRIPAAQFTKDLRVLINEYCVIEKSNTMEFSITSQGIKIISQYWQRVIDTTNF